MPDFIDTIGDAINLDSNDHRIAIRVFVADQLGEKSFLIADEVSSCQLDFENDKLLQLRFFKVGEFVKILDPIKSSDGKGLVMAEKSKMIPSRKFKTAEIKEASIFGETGISMEEATHKNPNEVSYLHTYFYI